MNSPLFPHGKVLLCPPEFFDVTYEINPWMHKATPPRRDQAAAQWKELHHTILRLGCWVEYVAPHTQQPDLVFTANAGLVRGTKVMLAKFRFAERAGEEALFEAWFKAHGFTVSKPRTGTFEGEGDALFAGETLFTGYGFRSDRLVSAELKGLFEISSLVECQLIDPRFYHLDTCFTPLTAKLALAFPPAFSPETYARMKNEIEIIPLDEDEALQFACNSVVLGSNIIMPSGCPKIAQQLVTRGFQVHPVELNEFLKSGGSAKCLTLKLQN